MKVLMVFFWLHNGIFFLASMSSVGELLVRGGTQGQLNVIPLILAWIAGSLMFGIGGVIAGLLPKQSA